MKIKLSNILIVIGIGIVVYCLFIKGEGICYQGERAFIIKGLFPAIIIGILGGCGLVAFGCYLNGTDDGEEDAPKGIAAEFNNFATGNELRIESLNRERNELIVSLVHPSEEIKKQGNGYYLRGAEGEKMIPDDAEVGSICITAIHPTDDKIYLRIVEQKKPS